MIIWKDIRNEKPTNRGKYYPNNPETPFVSCIVVNEKGLVNTVRWDSNKNDWLESDLGYWVLNQDLKITHFVEVSEINLPNIQKNDNN